MRFSLSLAAVVWCLSAVSGHGAVTVGHLRTEYLRNPAGIDVPQPRLSWWMLSDERGQRQTACQILVSSSPERLARNEGDVWDSGRTNVTDNAQVPYGGRTLVSGEACHWKVRVWDRKGKASPWSEPARWSMGLLAPEDWKARWIGLTSTNVGPAPLLRKTFAVGRDVKRATVYVSGLGFFEMHLNGKRVGDQELDPGFTRYDRRVLYVTHDVTSLLARGTNALAVMLGNGWYDYSVLAKWNFENAPWRDRPRLLCQLSIEYADGTREMVVSDRSWKGTTGPLLESQLLTGETWDARREIAGWEQVTFDDSAWPAVREVSAPAGRLSAQMSEPVRIRETVPSVSVTTPSPGVHLFDFGRSLAAVPRLKVSGPAGTEVVMRFGEVLTSKGTLDVKQIATHTLQPGFQTDRYVLSGKSNETWRARFTYHGFRYAEVTGLPSAPAAGTLEALALHADFEDAGSFECSNDLLNRIQQCTRRSYLNNFISIPTDCPQREKNGWTGDAHLAVETGLYNFHGAASYTKWMQDFQDEQPASGELPGTVPTAGFGYKWGNGPAWDSAYLLIPWAMYQHLGDRRILERHYDNFKRYVDYVERRSPNGIAAFGLGDWCPADSKTPADLTSTAYAAVDARLVSRIAGLLGRSEDEAHYKAVAERFTAAFHQKYFKPDTASYAEGTQTALACALYQGMTSPEHAARVASNLVAAVERRDNHLDCGILGTKYLLHALSDAGRSDVALRVATQTTKPSWGYWLSLGATTLWEDWTAFPGSRDHIMFGDISAWSYRVLAGIRPDPAAPGFKHIIIRPDVTAGLDWVKAHHDTPQGRVSVSWARGKSGLKLEVVIPPNATAMVHVPAARPEAVTEGGRPLTAADGVTVKREAGGVAVGVGSGRYTFFAPLP